MFGSNKNVAAAVLSARYREGTAMHTNSWNYACFKKAFYARTGFDLNCYKDRQMERRIRQIMQRENKPDYKLFYEYLAADAEARKNFCRQLTINTSEFFRDGKVFDCLRDDVFPQLLHNYPQGLKIWSAGCSMGAEPLSIAILLHQLNALGRAEIIATDIDENVLMIAQKGCFSFQYLSKVPEKLLKCYFEKEGRNYLIKGMLKKAVVYQKHNLLTAKPLPHCHLILCRNVFIYFTPETQNLLLERFSCSLRPGGFLVIGAAEYISKPGDFKLHKHQNSIYQKQ